MPLYDVHCEDHGYFRDIFAKLSEVDTLVCKICGKPVRRVVSPVMTVGYTESKPLKLDQVGRTFTSNDQWRTYLKANPTAQVLSANSKDWRDHRDTVRSKCDRTAKKMGYNDHEHRVTHGKRERKLKARLGS
jgi:putative FmdB family regulatory protein